MPITISTPPGQIGGQTPFPPIVGPGLNLILQSDFIGPFPSDAQWNLEIDLQPDLLQRVYLFQRPCTGPLTQIDILANDVWSTTRGSYMIVGGRNAEIDAKIVTSTSVTDSGHVAIQWNDQEGLGQQAFLLSQLSTGGQGGFTAADRQQLQAIETRTQTIGEPEQLVVQTPSGLQMRTIGQMLSRPTLDLLTLAEATSGPTGDPVRFSINEYYFGVIVRVTTIASDLVAKTPDLEWYFQDLAVLRVFRGADLQFRRGIHTPTFMTEHPWEWGLPILNQTDILGIPPDITIAVDWRVGCAGQVFLQRFP